jgi:hypothetical protein
MASRRKSAQQMKFAAIARKCQRQVGKGGGKARAKRVGACMRDAFRK